MQDSKGDYLVTRLAPCFKCVKSVLLKTKPKSSLDLNNQDNFNLSSSFTSNNENWNSLETDEKSRAASLLSEKNSIADDELEKSDFSIDNNENCKLKLKLNEKNDWIYCFMLDDVCHSVLKDEKLQCPKHGEQSAHLIAPNLAFEDIEDKYLIKTCNLKIERIIGRITSIIWFCVQWLFDSQQNEQYK